MEKTSIPLIALAVFSIVILLAYGNVEKVFAISVTSFEFKASPTFTNGGWVGYSSTLNYVIVRDSSGTDEFDVLDVNDLSLHGSVARPAEADSMICGVSGSCLFTNGGIAYFTSSDTGATPDAINLHKLNLNTLTITTLQIADIASIDGATDFNGCTPNPLIRVGSTSYTWISGAACANRGLYSIDYTASANWLTRINDDASNYSFDDGCYSTGGSVIVWSLQLGNSLVIVTTGGTVQELNLGAVIKNVYCVPSSDKVLVSSEAGDWVKLVEVTGTPSLVATTTIGEARDIVMHATEVYVSRSSTTSVTICEYSDTATMNCNASVVINTSASLVKGNATTFFSVSAPAGGAGIVYAIGGLEDDGQEEEEEEGSTNGICNLGTALDCVGGNNAIGGLATLTAPMNATAIGNTLGQGVGIIDPNNDDVKTNGVGLLYMLMTGVFFAGALVATIAKLNSKGWVNMSVKEIDPIFWLFLVVGVVSGSFYIGWVPDIVFYGMMAGLAGLVTIGVLKHTGKI